jgi:hypothetical protein
MADGSSAAQHWNEAHRKTNSSASADSNVNANATPSRLYTDENPATTIKGTGFKNKRIAQRTIELTSQPGARYKQYWTIRAMRERAAHHPHLTDGMRDAMMVFDEWLYTYKEPSEEERRDQRKEWEAFHKLCQSDANQHSYGKDPSKGELNRARKDISEGQSLLFEILSRCRPKREFAPILFPLTCFVAIFGGPGLHGYGKHTINPEDCTSQVDIDSLDGIEELLGRAKTRKLTIIMSTSQIQVNYDRKQEMASVSIEQSGANLNSTLTDLWGQKATKKDTYNNKRKREGNGNANVEEKQCEQLPSWTCPICTFVHAGQIKLEYLTCEVCGFLKN